MLQDFKLPAQDLVIILCINSAVMRLYSTNITILLQILHLKQINSFSCACNARSWFINLFSYSNCNVFVFINTFYKFIDIWIFCRCVWVCVVCECMRCMNILLKWIYFWDEGMNDRIGELNNANWYDSIRVGGTALLLKFE